MRPKLIIAGGLIFAGIIAIGFGAFKYFQSQKPNSGLKIETTPEAIVFVENVQVGQTPIDKMFKSGEATLRIVPSGKNSVAPAYQTKVRLTPQFYTVIRREFGDTDEKSSGDTVYVEPTSSKTASMSIIVSGPDSASVSVDGQNQGFSPVLISTVNVGGHQIVASAPGYVSRNVNANAVNGNKTVVQIKLAREDSLDKQEVTTPSPTLASKITPTPTAKNTSVKIKKVEIKDTPTGFLRVREEASTTAKEIGKVNPGEKYTVIDSKTGWYKIEVKLENNDSGWISATYAKPLEN